MSTSIQQSLVTVFSESVYVIGQQMDSRAAKLVRQENFQGETKFLNRVNSQIATLKTSRHSATPQNDSGHTGRYCDTLPWEAGDAIDITDDASVLFDPKNVYAKLIAAAMARRKDQIIIDAALGSARTPAGLVTLPAANTISASTVNTAAGLTGVTAVTYAGLNALKAAFRRTENDAYGRMGSSLIAMYNSTAMQQILSDSRLTSGDFNADKLYGRGPITDTWWGFTWVPCELVPAGQLICFNSEAIAMGTSLELKSYIAPDPSASFSTRIYGTMKCGAVRMEEDGVFILSYT